jgi:hypothetical protein
MATVKKMYTISPDLVQAVKDFVKDNPDYEVNGRSSESAAVRDAITLFLSQKSSDLDRQPERKAS